MMTTRLTVATMQVPTCARCSGEMHDNRSDKPSAKAPDFRCKDPDCVDDQGRRSALWARDLLKPAPKAAQSNGPRPPAPAATAKPDLAPDAARFQAVSRAHFRALQFCLTHELPLMQKLPGDVAGAVAAMTATILIATLKENDR